MLYLPYPEMYQCRKCGEWKRWALFQKNKGCPNGIEKRCLECKRLHNKAWSDAHPENMRQSRSKWYSQHPDKAKEWHDNHPDKVREIQKRYTDNHREELNEKSKRLRREQPEIDRQYKKKWRDANLDKQHEAEKRWRNANPDKVKAIDSRHAKKYPEKSRAKVQLRNARKRALPATFTDTDWQRCLDYWQHVCAYCGNGPSLTQKTKVLIQEHFIPITSGGPYTPDNIVPACKSCNSQKQDLDPAKWTAKRFGEHEAEAILQAIAVYFEWVKSQGL